jgi:hypothetical protein
MKKKLLVLCLVVMFVLPVTVFAGGFLGLKVGGAVILNDPITFTQDNPDTTDVDETNLKFPDPKDIGLEDVSFGADIRFNISIIEIASLIQGQFMKGSDANTALGLNPPKGMSPGPMFGGDADVAYLYGQVGVGVSLELLGLVDFGVTVGPELGIYASEALQIPTVNFDDYEKFPLLVRATVDINLGGISVGGFVKVDPGVNIGNVLDTTFDWKSILTIPTQATAGLSVMVSLF